MAKSTKTKKVVQTPEIITEEVPIPEPIFDADKIEKRLKELEKMSDEQKIISYIENSHTENVDLVPLLKSLYPLPNYSEPAIYYNQMESKRLKAMLEKMVLEGKIVMYDESYLKLGKHYYIENDTKTKYHTIDSLKIIAVK